MLFDMIRNWIMRGSGDSPQDRVFVPLHEVLKDVQRYDRDARRGRTLPEMVGIKGIRLHNVRPVPTVADEETLDWCVFHFDKATSLQGYRVAEIAAAYGYEVHKLTCVDHRPASDLGERTIKWTIEYRSRFPNRMQHENENAPEGADGNR